MKRNTKEEQHVTEFFFFMWFISLQTANLCTLSYAIAAGWMGIEFPLYKTEDCPLPSGRVELHELGWIASFLGVGGLIGTVASGWMADRFGRKYSMMSMAVPQLVSANVSRERETTGCKILSMLNHVLKQKEQETQKYIMMNQAFIFQYYHQWNWPNVFHERGRIEYWMVCKNTVKLWFQYLMRFLMKNTLPFSGYSVSFLHSLVKMMFSFFFFVDIVFQPDDSHKISKKIIIYNSFFFFLGQCCFDNFSTKCLLFVRITFFNGNCWWRCFCFDTFNGGRNCRR